MKLSIKIDLRDIWIGAYWHLVRWGKTGRCLDIYVCIVPCLPIRFRFERPSVVELSQIDAAYAAAVDRHWRHYEQVEKEIATSRDKLG